MQTMIALQLRKCQIRWMFLENGVQCVSPFSFECLSDFFVFFSYLHLMRLYSVRCCTSQSSVIYHHLTSAANNPEPYKLFRSKYAAYPVTSLVPLPPPKNGKKVFQLSAFAGQPDQHALKRKCVKLTGDTAS
jgi:hypothetical protein